MTAPDRGLALAVAVVSFDTRDVLEPCLESIAAARPFETVVVDGDAQTAAAICAVVADEETRRQTAERARAWALRDLGFSSMADRYEGLYARLEHRRGAQGR